MGWRGGSGAGFSSARRGGRLARTLAVALVAGISSCTPTIRFEVAGPAVSGYTTIQGCPSPVPSPGIGASGVVSPSGAVPARR